MHKTEIKTCLASTLTETRIILLSRKCPTQMDSFEDSLVFETITNENVLTEALRVDIGNEEE